LKFSAKPEYEMRKGKEVMNQTRMFDTQIMHKTILESKQNKVSSRRQQVFQSKFVLFGERLHNKNLILSDRRL